MSDALADIRARLDAIDAQLVALLAERASAVGHAWQYKDAHGLAHRDPEREAAIATRLAELSDAHGLDRAAVAQIFAQIVGRDLRS